MRGMLLLFMRPATGAGRGPWEVCEDMPTYEYECKGCGYRFEKFQSITAAPLRLCPKCGEEVTRLIGAGSGVIFKGSGFYKTDYRSADYKRRAKEESAVGSGKDSGEKSDKPAGKGGGQA